MWEFLVDSPISSIPDNKVLTKNKLYIFSGKAKCKSRTFSTLGPNKNSFLNSLYANVELKTTKPCVFRETMLQEYKQVRRTRTVNKHTENYYVWEWTNSMPSWEKSICESPSIGDHTVHDQEKDWFTLLSDVQSDHD